MLNIDHFKRVNDNYGHAMGDVVISSLAMLLRQQLRQSDIIGRYGGEEFVAVLADCDVDSALQIINKLRLHFSSLRFTHGGTEFSCTFSAGIACSTDFPNEDKTQTNNQYATSGYGTLDLNDWWHIDEHFLVNAGLFNLTDKRYWHWNNVQGLSSTDPGLARASQPGRHAAINLVWEL